jgi:hypothetical protein
VGPSATDPVATAAAKATLLAAQPAAAAMWVSHRLSGSAIVDLSAKVTLTTFYLTQKVALRLQP